MKRPSLKGCPNTKHLGHFAKDEFIQAGHNTVPESKEDTTLIYEAGPFIGPDAPPAGEGWEHAKEGGWHKKVNYDADGDEK